MGIPMVPLREIRGVQGKARIREKRPERALEELGEKQDQRKEGKSSFQRPRGVICLRLAHLHSQIQYGYQVAKG